uniref:NADP-dependent oxidoreductase domain-containing protein n=1 Tax=Oryza glumipatula TaxID=40148 RepID=A0A0E0B765_9ORYZ
MAALASPEKWLASAAAAATIPEAALKSGKPMPLVGMGTASFPLDAPQLPATVRDAVLRALSATATWTRRAAAYGTEAPLGEAILEAGRAGMVASRDDLYIDHLWISDTHPGRVLSASCTNQPLNNHLNLQMDYIDLYLIHWPIRLRVEQETPSPVYDNDFVMMDMEGVVPPNQAAAAAVAQAAVACFVRCPWSCCCCNIYTQMDACMGSAWNVVTWPIGGPIKILTGVWKDIEECQRLGLTKAIGVSNFTCKKLNTLLSFATIPPAANQVCLRWLHEQGDCIIVKSFNERRLRENLEIFDWELTDADRRR